MKKCRKLGEYVDLLTFKDDLLLACVQQSCCKSIVASFCMNEEADGVKRLQLNTKGGNDYEFPSSEMKTHTVTQRSHQAFSVHDEIILSDRLTELSQGTLPPMKLYLWIIVVEQGQMVE